ncbi:beta-ketoacyl reductase, partial [Kitasatospora putterlickiae]|uniref:beta-ketoacyl reductase n=1 Tax=Kitasatospora putterlickiae TaxID=221725 RepID=UPI0031D7FCE8
VAVVGPEAPEPARAAAWGVLRAAQSAHPGRFLLVDLDGGVEPEWGALLAADEPQLAVRGGQVLAPRLAAVAAGPVERTALTNLDGTVLVTGGAGAGTAVALARHLAVRHGVRDLLLIDGHDAATDGLVDELARLGARVRVEGPAPERLPALLESLDRPLRAVVQAGDEPLESAWRLHELTADAGLAVFVVSSSYAALLGDGEDPAALEALVRTRRAAGLPGTVLVWGPRPGEEAPAGTAGLTAERAGELFDQALAADAALLAPVQLDPAELRAQARERTLPALLRGLARIPARREAAGGSLAERLAEVPDADRERVVLELVTAQVVAVLGHGADDSIDVERKLKELGLDSMSAVGLRNRLSQATGLSLPVSFVFEHPTPAEIARQLVKLAGTGTAEQPEAPAGTGSIGDGIGARLRRAAEA